MGSKLRCNARACAEENVHTMGQSMRRRLGEDSYKGMLLPLHSAYWRCVGSPRVLRFGSHHRDNAVPDACGLAGIIFCFFECCPGGDPEKGCVCFYDAEAKDGWN